MTRYEWETKVTNVIEDAKYSMTAKEFEKFIKNIRILVNEKAE